jgi:hypothetical protein
MDEPTSELVDDEAIRSGRFVELIDSRLRRTLRKTHLKSIGYQMLRHSNRPKLIGWNMAVWRDHLEQVNGFDEQFRGWGCEDDDLAARLRMSGVRIATALGYTHGYHLWHPPHATTPDRWNEGPNVAYFRRPLVLARCLEGIRSRSLSQVSVRVVGSGEHAALTNSLARTLRESTKGPEIELLVWPCRPHFSAERACRVLVAASGASIPATIEQSAQATIRLGTNQDAADVLDALQGLLSGERGVQAEAVKLQAAA